MNHHCISRGNPKINVPTLSVFSLQQFQNTFQPFFVSALTFLNQTINKEKVVKKKKTSKQKNQNNQLNNTKQETERMRKCSLNISGSSRWSYTEENLAMWSKKGNSICSISSMALFQIWLHIYKILDILRVRQN